MALKSRSMKHNKHINIAYGSKELPLTLPAGSMELLLQVPEQIVTPSLFQQRLQNYLREHPLDLSNPVLVVADKTRLCGYPEYLPIMIGVMEQLGMDPARLKIIIAYGTHPPQSEDECLQAYGSLYGKLCFVHHDCNDDCFVELGSTSRGTPIRGRQDLIEASAVITMGPICHHYFAGYGGGRKLIFPGCGEREAIYTNHGLYLNRRESILASGCQPGNLDGNPLAEDLFEIEDQLSADLSIHGILNSHGNLCDILLGRGRDVFLNGCRIHGTHCEISSPQFKTVIASCGGYPKDINFIQSHKALHNASMFVQDGGLLIIYAECRDGIGSKTFLPWFTKGSFEKAFQELSGRYEGNGGTALAMMTKLQRIRIGLITSLDTSTCDLIGVESWHHEKVAEHLASLPASEDVAFIPNASLLVRSNQSL